MRNLGMILGAAAGGWVALAGGCELIAGVEDAMPYPADGGTGSGGGMGGGGATATSTTGGNVEGCDDGTLDGNETGEDCGGPCKPCSDGEGCKVGPDCTSKVCIGGTCIQPKCTDQIKNGTETGADCGGAACPHCPSGEGCSLGDDCQSSICNKGLCVIPPSCGALAATCGAGANESCCATPRVTGGTYNRSNDANFPAKVSDFRLDKFEVTVGRFRKFVDAYPGSKPALGTGQHPLIADSGWDSSWDQKLPADQAALTKIMNGCPTYPTWTDTAGANETKPLNCVSWFEAFAFCIWDGGRLPTEAEWNYAAAGGAQQRVYPWGTNIDESYAVYDCAGDGSLPGPGNCAFTDILNVGARAPKGDGLWGQADLGGSVWEWTLDANKSTYANPCNDCANIDTFATSRTIRGGSWAFPQSNVVSSYRYSANASGGSDSDNLGFRCARAP